MTNEIILSPYQATVFTAAEARLKTQGYLGMALFEDTYVLSKKLAEYIKSNVNPNGGSHSTHSTNAYNYVLGISTSTPSGGGGGTDNNSTIIEDLEDEFLIEEQADVALGPNTGLPPGRGGGNPTTGGSGTAG